LKITVSELPSRRLLALRHIGSYRLVGVAFAELVSLADRRGLIGPTTEFLGLSYDNPETTDERALRYDACITSSATDVEAPLLVGEHAGGKHVVHRHVGPYELIPSAFAELLNHVSEFYEFRSGPCVEIYRNDAERTPAAELITDLCVPVL
jgi:AraC family transcriptional regulator